MSKSKKKTKKNSVSLAQTKKPLSPQTQVRLSQVMIVKNEEKNIEAALGWAKDVAYEQIIVDTGSTDRTVELAEKMGAKIYHFEWINDFGAAKNYAIEQATGDWIAFLDADEYFSPEDTKKLMKLLADIESNAETGKNTTVLRMPWIQLNERGEAFATYRQSRIFRNIKEIRYKGKIHEALTGVGDIVFIDDISIMHTGYASSAFEETSKLERNIELLREELKENPENIKIKAYLADSLNNKARIENPEGTGADPEADILFDEVLKSDVKIDRVLKKKAYVYFIVKYLNDADKFEECEELCEKALEEYEGDLDFRYFQASVLNRMGVHDRAWELLKEIEHILANVSHHGDTVYVNADPTLLHGQMLSVAQALEDVDNVIKYATIVLKSDKTKQNILSPFIYTLRSKGASEEDVLELLSEIYNLGDPNDLMLIARAAKNCGEIDFARIIMTIAGEMLES